MNINTKKSSSSKDVQIEESTEMAAYFDLSLDLLCLASTEGILLRVNSSWIRVLGYEKNEIEGKPFNDFLHPEDVEKTWEAMSCLFGGEEVRNFVNRFLDKEGKVHFFQWNSRMEGELIYASARDVTETLELEENLKKTKDMLNQCNSLARIGTWELDLKTKDLTWSDVTKEIHEVELDFNCEVEKGIEFYKEGEDREKITQAVEDGLKDGTPWDVELRIITAKGRERWVRAVGLVEIEAGEPKRIYGTFQDIDELKKSELALREKNRLLALSMDQAEKAVERAAKANEAKSNFLANMSHEIRTPMNWIMGTAELVQGTKLTRQQSEWMGTIQNSTDHLLTVINDILDFSQTQSGKLKIHPIPFNLRENIFETLEPLREKFSGKGIRMLVQISKELGPVWVGDYARIRQILVNLISNSIKFTKKGFIKLDIQPGSKGLIVSIEDTGVGIPLDRQEKLFQPFEQADNTRVRRYGGTGLGLAICRKLAEMMGGKIELNSIPNRGTRIDVYLNLNPGESLESKKEVIARDAMKPVLLLDANPDSRKVFAGQLVSIGFEVYESDEGERALEILKAEDIGLVLVDVALSGLPLLKLITSMREKNSDLNFVALSYAPRAGEVKELIKSGFGAYLTLPMADDIIKGVLELAARGSEEVVTRYSLPREIKGESTETMSDPLQGIHVMVAEDNMINFKVVNRLLERQGARVTHAINGEEVLKAVRDDLPDVILMDLHMPELDGLRATEKLREIEEEGEIPRLPIVALTADAMAQDRQRCLEAGMDEYLSKPIRSQQLISMILHVIKKFGSSKLKQNS